MKYTVCVGLLAVLLAGCGQSSPRSTDADAARSGAAGQAVAAAQSSFTRLRPLRVRPGKAVFSLANITRGRVVGARLQAGKTRRWLRVYTVQTAAGGQLQIALGKRLRQALKCTPRRCPASAARRLRLHLQLTDGVCPAGPFPDGQTVPGCWRPYADSSPWNRPVPQNPRLLENSAQIVQRLTEWGPPQRLTANGGYGHPLYWARPSDPEYVVRCVKYGGQCEIAGHRVRIPTAAQAAYPAYPDGDAHMAVVQPDGWEYDFWQVRKKPPGGGELEISYGGRTRIDGDGLDSNATAGLFGLAAGMIRGPELAAGEINHALFMVALCDGDYSVYPTTDHEGRECQDIGQSNTHAPPMGARFWLDMSPQEIAALSEPAWKKTLLVAMARYGMIVGDTGGSSWGMMMEAPETYTSFDRLDPATEWARAAGWGRWVNHGRVMYTGDYRFVVDWRSRLRVLDPCVSRGDC